MCSSFYGQAPLPAAAGDELENIIMISEEEEKGEENERQQAGDLADMVRSSANHDRLRRRGSDDIYPQDVCSSNHHHHQNNMILWSSLTSAAAADEICSVDHNRINSTTSRRSNMSCQECCCLVDDADHNIIVEYMQAAAAANDVADDPFKTTAIDQHRPLIHPINNHYNNDMFLSPQQELLHDDLPLITTTISSGGCGVSMKSFNYSKSAAAAQEAAQDHRQRANSQTSYLHSSTTTCPANNNTASEAPLATVAYVTSIITTHGRHSTSSTASSSSVSGCRQQQQQLKPPINCNVFSQMLHISSSSTNVDMLLAPPSSKMVQQLHPQQQASSTSSLALAAVVGSGSGNDHITSTSSNYSTRHHSSSGSMPADQMLLINEDQNRINCTETTSSASGCDMSTLLHISSSPSNPAIKRSRKSLSKKVVCIPAPTPANSRPSGEVVPSDLWAWRKYGQKPIKGSPYPRGYYRCSSSKGCSARKQVERSRTDPNMLVITYTSEHNHPWPTQRNALAGSIRSHPSKNSTTCASNSAASWTSGVNDQMKIRRTSNDSNIGSDELKPADEMGAMICKQQQKVLDDHDHVVVDASVQDYSNYHDQREDINSNGDCELEDEHYWRCSYKIDRPEEHNEQSVQEDFFGELGEIAGKDHNGFSSFLMDYSASDKAVMYMNHAS